MVASPPHVTVVAHEIGTLGGMERQLAELCTGLLERGYTVTAIARRCEIAPHPRLRFVRVRCPGRPFTLKFASFFVLGSLAVMSRRDGLVHTTGAIVVNRADASTVHFCHHGFRAAVGSVQMSRSSVGYRLNARATSWLSMMAERLCYRPVRTRRLIAVSGGVARELDEFFPMGPADVTVIPNGVDHAAFSRDAGGRAAIRASLGIDEDALVALFVGGDWERKGLRFAIEGVAGADGWHLLVIGPGDQEGHRALAEQAGAGGRIHFVGSTPDAAPYFAGADAFLLPTSYEAFPLVSLEAAAAGLPLLLGRVSGVEELLAEGENGWFAERDGAAIAEQLRTLGTEPRLRAAMGSAARKSSARYTWDTVVDAYARLYPVLAQPGRAAPHRAEALR